MVAGYARDRDHDCPVEGHGGDCAGPLSGNSELPCPTCCDATRSAGVDEYNVWTTVVELDRDRNRDQSQAQASTKGAASATVEAAVTTDAADQDRDESAGNEYELPRRLGTRRPRRGKNERLDGHR